MEYDNSLLQRFLQVGSTCDRSLQQALSTISLDQLSSSTQSELANNGVPKISNSSFSNNGLSGANLFARSPRSLQACR